MAVWDYSFARPNLAGQGLEGVVRYLDFLPNGKVLSIAERDQIFSLGIPILLNWENGATDMRGGASVGATHGKEANRQADTLGWPKDRPIVYSADWDVQPGEYNAVEAYLRAASAQGRPAGFYGGIGPLDAMVSRGATAWAWQTLAWSHGKVSPNAMLYQDGVNSPNGTDHNKVMKSDWGQYHPNMNQGVFMALSDQQQADLSTQVADLHNLFLKPTSQVGAGVPWTVDQTLQLTRTIGDEVTKLLATPPGSVALTDVEIAQIASMTADKVIASLITHLQAKTS